MMSNSQPCQLQMLYVYFPNASGDCPPLTFAYFLFDGETGLQNSGILSKVI